MKAWVPTSALCGLALVSGLGVSGLRSEVSPGGQHTGLNAHETHAAASLLGQFRTSVSGWLWVRTDLYLHNGVAMRPITEAEMEAGRRGVGSRDSNAGHHNDAFIVTVIPSAERDFRGVFGDLERATQTYKDMTNHGHNDPRTALPLFRLMTWFDPQFVPGWTTGAAVLAMGRERDSYLRAVEFLNEGLKRNPASISILNQLGFTYVARLKDLRAGADHFEQARAVARSVPNAQLSFDDRESLEETYRWLALVYRNQGRLTEQYAVLREGLRRFPEDVPLNRMLNAPPLVLRASEAPAPEKIDAQSGH